MQLKYDVKTLEKSGVFFWINPDEFQDALGCRTISFSSSNASSLIGFW
jgi:hypothetical protein